MSEDAELLMGEIDRWTSKPPRRPGDITAQEYAAHAGITRGSAQNHLGHLVEQGRLETEIVCAGGRWIRVYRRKVE